MREVFLKESIKPLINESFLQAHLSNRHNNFDFQKYIQRSLEEDFKTLVGIRFGIVFVIIIENYTVLHLSSQSLLIGKLM